MATHTTHTIVMTGASRGLGAVAAERIVSGDPHAQLVVIGRSAGPASERTTFVDADLGSMVATAEAARKVSSSIDRGDLPPLDRFVGNAGIQYTDATTSTPEGLEATFAVNVVANHVLIGELWSRMVAPSRIVITVSDTHFGDFRHNLGMVPAPVWKSPDVLARTAAFAKPDSSTAGRTAYSTSKLAAIYLVHALARSLPDGVDVVSFNPGLVPGTGLVRNADRFTRRAMTAVGPLLSRTPIATSPVTAGGALADVVLGRTPVVNGDYVDRDRVVPSSNESYDPKREAELVRFLDSL